MDGYSHLSIAEREDIMVRWKGHEGVSQIARELHRDKSTISRDVDVHWEVTQMVTGS